jgi:Ca2+-binding EF-hand superfamily protein
MLSQETQKRLVILLLNIAECERITESSRQDLCGNPNFDPLTVFHSLSHPSTTKISSSDIKSFIAKRNNAITSLHLHLLIAQYDTNQDSKLDLDEFLSFILSVERPDLRTEALQRSIPSLSLYLESLLVRHIETESNCQGQLQTFKRSLCLRPDFSVMEAFRSIEKTHCSYIDALSVLQFLKRFEDKADSLTAERIIRRLDRDKDGIVKYEEFVAGILPDRKKKPLRKKQKGINACSTRTTAFSSKTVISSPQLEKGSARCVTRNGLSGIRNLMMATKKCEKLREVVNVIRAQIGIDSEIERAKISLVRHKDFNMQDMMRIVDKKQRNSINCNDIEKLLRELQVPYHIDEVYLLMKHLSKTMNCVLSYQEMEDLFLPRDLILGKMTQSRGSIFNKDRFMTFDSDTMEDLVRLLKITLKNENFAEILRRKLAQQTWIDLENIFKKIDKDCDSFIGFSDLQQTLHDYEVICEDKEVRNCILRYTKGENDKLRFSSFLRELTPLINQ